MNLKTTMLICPSIGAPKARNPQYCSIKIIKWVMSCKSFLRLIKLHLLTQGKYQYLISLIKSLFYVKITSNLIIKVSL